MQIAGSVAAVSRTHDLANRGTPLEYWFWTVRTREVGLIVDLIIRRQLGLAEVRVSAWTPSVQPVVHDVSTTWSADAFGVRVGSAHVDANGSTGSAGAIAWDLSWELGPARLAPRPGWLGPLHPFDMELVGMPRAHLRGSLHIGDRALLLDDPGTVNHYWGRRLPDSWAWVSVIGSDEDRGFGLEALLVQSRLWGRRARIPAGYVWLLEQGRVEQTVVPLTGVVSASAGATHVEITSLRMDGRRHRISCTAASESFNDAGEGIRQSVLATASLDGRQIVAGTAMLELRSRA